MKEQLKYRKKNGKKQKMLEIKNSKTQRNYEK